MGKLINSIFVPVPNCVQSWCTKLFSYHTTQRCSSRQERKASINSSQSVTIGDVFISSSSASDSGGLANNWCACPRCPGFDDCQSSLSDGGFPMDQVIEKAKSNQTEILKN